MLQTKISAVFSHYFANPRAAFELTQAISKACDGPHLPRRQKPSLKNGSWARRTLERAAITSHEKGVQPLRGWFAIQSSRDSRRRVGCLAAAGKQTGSGRVRLHVTCPWFRSPF